MDMVPRISRAQKMDALSSMANIAGYRAVIEAGKQFRPLLHRPGDGGGQGSAGQGAGGWCAVLRVWRPSAPRPALAPSTYAFDVCGPPPRSGRTDRIGWVPSSSSSSSPLTNCPTARPRAGYAPPQSPEFQAKQLAKFREIAPEMDIVITTALIPGRPAPVLWTKDMVEAMKPGSVIIDLAAERGGNCELTKADERIVTDNGVVIIGYTDFPSRMAAQSSDALFHQYPPHDDRPDPRKRTGRSCTTWRDDVIRGATAVFGGEITYPPPPPKVQAIAAQKREKPKELTPEEKRAAEIAAFKAQTKNQVTLLAVGGALVLGVGLIAPASFMQHFIVFVLSVFIGFQVIWNVAHSLHTPLMAVTNAISSIIILGALMQIGSSSLLITILAALGIFMAAVNIFGGFLVTRRMLAMFQKS